jgi:hypothetical protein
MATETKSNQPKKATFGDIQNFLLHKFVAEKLTSLIVSKLKVLV